MSKEKLTRVIDAIALLALAHVVFYAFTGMTFAAVSSSNQGVVLTLLHVAAIVAPTLVRVL